VWRGSVSPHSGGTVPELHRIPLPLAGICRPQTSIASAVTRSRAVTLWLPVVLWAAVIFAISSIPSLSTGLGTWDTLLRKAAHMSEFAVLGALLYRALGREVPALAAGVAYAATDELHQSFVSGRHASVVDVAIDAAGVAAGMLAWFWIQRR
jgi:VanZ family protein